MASFYERHCRPSSSVKNKFDLEKRKFFKACRKSKRDSWKNFTSGIDNPQKMALLNRILKSNRFGGIGLLKNQNGD